MRLIPPVLIAYLLTTCSSPGWDGRVESWGSMRAVMGEGRTEGRVALLDVTQPAGTVGIGALAGLMGEIAVVDGVCWIARVEGDELRFDRGARRDDSAALLAIATVQRWRATAVDRDVTNDGLDALLATTARDTGLGRRAWPFVIEGDFTDVESHVLRGQCPHAGEVDAAHEPARRSFTRVRGRLIGFYAPDAAGELVHHGQTWHAHLLVEEPELYVGHVDATGVAAGALLLVPALD